MRKIKMIGTGAASSIYDFGETVFVGELEAHYAASVGELAYADSRDAVSAAQVAALLAELDRRGRQRAADITGRSIVELDDGFKEMPGAYVRLGVGDPDAVAALVAKTGRVRRAVEPMNPPSA